MGGRDEPLSDELLKYIDIISPNETEFERVIKKKLSHGDDSIKKEIYTFLE